MTLSKKEQAVISLIIIGLITIAIIIIEIQIAIIHFYQNIFWISLIVSPILLIVAIIFLFCGIFKEDNYGYYENEVFTKGAFFVLAFIIFILSISSFFIVMPYSYQKGYSDQALQNLAEKENQLASLQQLRGVFTGEIMWDVANQAIEETINNLCNDPNYPCEQTKKSFQYYKDIKGMKDDADEIMGYLGFIEMIDKRLDKQTSH